MLLSTVDGDVLYVWHVLVAPVQHWHASSHTWIAYIHLLWQPQLCLCRVLQGEWSSQDYFFTSCKEGKLLSYDDDRKKISYYLLLPKVSFFWDQSQDMSSSGFSPK